MREKQAGRTGEMGGGGGGGERISLSLMVVVGEITVDLVKDRRRWISEKVDISKY